MSAAKKKDFSKIPGDPTAAFFSAGEAEQQLHEPQEPQEPQEQEKPKKETKSKRINVLLKPSLFENLRKISVLSEVSVNRQIELILEGYVEGQEGKQALALYETVQQFKSMKKGGSDE